ncbi:MAG: cytidine deaminase [Opitutales bacterium]
MEPDNLPAAQARMGLSFPTSLDSTIKDALSHPQFSGYFETASCEKSDIQKDLLPLAREFSKSPISGFKVGAVALGKSGNCYLGANMEFTGVPLHASLHAEQSAVINAWMHGESALQALYVSETPCGHCRQFLVELHGAVELRLIVNGVARKLGELLPEPFAQKRPRGNSLLDSPAKGLVNIHKESRNHSQRAINAASRSYSPYSQSPEGFIIETINGLHFAGRTAESIAFNPSVPAVVAALNQLNLSAQRKVSISRCTHARLATALTHSAAFSEALLLGISKISIETVLMESAE